VAEAVARDGAQRVGGEVDGAVHGLLERHHLERGDEGAPAGRGGGAPGEADAELLPRGLHHGLVVRGEPAGVAPRRVHRAPPRAVDDLVEHRRRPAAVEPAVVVRRADQVPGVHRRRDRVAVLGGGRRVRREVPERGEHRHDARGVQLRHLAGVDERPVGDPCHVPRDLVRRRAAAYLVPCARAERANSVRDLRSRRERENSSGGSDDGRFTGQGIGDADEQDEGAGEDGEGDHWCGGDGFDPPIMQCQTPPHDKRRGFGPSGLNGGLLLWEVQRRRNGSEAKRRLGRTAAVAGGSRLLFCFGSFALFCPGGSS
jgi:hypothetical protein